VGTAARRSEDGSDAPRALPTDTSSDVFSGPLSVKPAAADGAGKRGGLGMGKVFAENKGVLAGAAVGAAGVGAAALMYQQYQHQHQTQTQSQQVRSLRVLVYDSLHHD